MLRIEQDLDRPAAREVACSVFAYFRWLRWLDPRKPLTHQVEHAVSLAERFARDPAGFSDGELLRLAIPDWIASETPVDARWARSLQQVPALWIRTKRGLSGKVASALGDCVPLPRAPLPEALEYRGQADLFRTEEFQSGAFELQDLSSQIVGLICDPRPGETWWDACAGEGGKTLHLSDLMENKGLIWASDRAEWRLRKLRLRMARAKAFNSRVALWSGGPKLPTKTLFSGVLVDAPCSGVGTWGRNPDARWTLKPSDVRELAALQLQLLENASAAVKPNGHLVYSVCTITRSETTQVAQVFVQRHPEFCPVHLSNPLDKRTASNGQLQLRPTQTRGNAMFIASWRRQIPGA